MVGSRRSRIVGIALVAALLMISSLATLSAPASAEGSRNAYPTNATCQANSLSGSCRANLEWRTSAYGPVAGQTIRRRTLLYVYMTTGQELLLGSSAVGVANGATSGDAIVYNPGVVTDANAATLPVVTTGTNGFKCSDQRTTSGIAAQGKITTRAQELAGPQAVSGGGNPTGYVPCHYTAPSTGFYNVVFLGPNGASNDTDAAVVADTSLASANDFNATQASSVAAWDTTVRANQTTTTNIDGRTFTYSLAAFTSKNAAPVNSSYYITTTDGFKYRTDLRGLDPNGFLIYGNQIGFLDNDGVTPLYHDVLGLTGGASMTTVSGGVTFSPPTYPLSFQPLAAETLAALSIPATPVVPSISAISFAGNVAGNTSVVGSGGTFSYTSTASGVYEIIVSRDGVSFDPGLPTNRVLRGVRASGTSTITWDGKDNAGTNFPVGVNYPFKATLQAGSYHFPFVDAENSTLGGPTFTLLNPPGGVCPFGNAACTTAFYDDRGYHSVGPTGSDVGTPGATLCGINPPTINHADPVTGYISSGNQRAFGQDSGGNDNTSCTGSFGDVKALDTWTFYPSSAVSSTLNIVAASISGRVYYDTNANGIYDSGEPAISGVTVTLRNSANAVVGTTTSAADGTYSFVPPSSGTYSVTETQPTAYNNGSTTAGTGGGTTTGTDDKVAAIVYTSGTAITGYNFGELGAPISGKVFVDGSNAPIVGVTVTLKDSGKVTVGTTTTAADGTYSFANVAPGSYTVNETQPAGYAAGLVNPSNVIAVTQTKTGLVNQNFSETGLGIGGKVFVDGSNAPLAGVTITLRDSTNAVVGTTVTAADGTYSFTNLLNGSYTVTETQPTGYGNGVVNPTNVIAVTLAGTSAVNQNFSEAIGSFSGNVYYDSNSNGTLTAGEPGLSGVTVTLTGTDALGAAVNRTTTSAADGSYSFANVIAGTYTVTESQPAAYNNGSTTAGSAGGTTTGTNDIVATIALAGGTNATGYNFGELGAPIAGKVFVDGTNAPLQNVTITLRDSLNNVVATTTTAADGTYTFANIAPGSYTVTETQPAGYGPGVVVPGNVINVTQTKTGSSDQNFSETTGVFQGTVYFDKNANGVLNGGEPGIGGVTVTLTGTDVNGPVSRTTTTAVDGTYSFGGLLSGTYTVTETQPAAYNNGSTTAGSAGGTTTGSNDIVSAITFAAGSTASGYNFGELGGPIAGTVFVDGTNAPLAGVTITLRDNLNNVVGTTTTAADGTYSFTNIAPGSYTVTETQPAGYGPGVVVPGNVINVTHVKAGESGQDFSEKIGSFAGKVYFDSNNNGAFDSGEPGISAVTVTLTGTDANGSAVNRTTTSAADGTYSFANVISGTYTITETQPAAYINRATTAGTAGGTTTGTNDIVAAIALTAGVDATGYNFGEISGPIAGKVFVDGSNAPIAGVTITLKDSTNATVATTTTAADGTYSFVNIAPGSYTIVETQPAGYAAGVVNPSNSIAVTQTSSGLSNQNFSEAVGAVTGTVFFDANANGSQNGGEPGIGGVTVALTGTDARGNPVDRTTTTAADGTYSFAGVVGGTYTVTETQPVAYNNGSTTAGTAGGTTTGTNDIVSAIALGAGVTGSGYTFGELGSGISGKVYQEVTNVPLAGVTITLRDSTNNVVGTTTTAPDGTYSFGNLPPGTYSIIETQPPIWNSVSPNTLNVTLTKTGLVNQDFIENYPPTAVDDYRSAPAGTPTVIDPLGNDTDPESDNLTITVVTPPASGGTVTIDPGSKTVTYTSPFNTTGYDVFTYTIIDGKGGSSTAKVHLFIDASKLVGNDKMYYFGLGGTEPVPTPGTAAGTYDQLALTGAVRLSNQQLVIRLRNGFMPSAGQTFDVLTAGSIGGAYAKVYGQVLPNGLVLAVHYLPDRVQLVAERALYVDTLTDAVDTSPGDGVCATAAGECSLRAAVQEANNPPQETLGLAIVLMPGKVHQLSIAGNNEDAAATGDLDLSFNIDILGQGATVNGGGLDREFHVIEANVTMTNLTLTNGNVTSGRVPGAGALFNEAGTIFLVDVNLTNNTGALGGGLGTYFGTTTLVRGAITGNTAGIGGGAAAFGYTLLDAVVVSNNTALNLGGGLAAGGGGQLVVNNAVVSSNTAPIGGGVGSTSPSVVQIARSTFSGNTATSKGGGLATNGEASFTDTRVTGNSAPEGAGVYNFGSLSLLRSTYDANTATVRGGGLVNDGGSTTINQSTLSGNQAPTGSALVDVVGGITVMNSTITKNRATGSAGSATIISVGGAPVSLNNSIVADQTQGPSCANPSTGVTSLGYNLSSDATCGLTATGDAQNLGALLGALANNGGWSPTHLPLAGSPAIGTGNPTCTGPDQRGYPRPRGGACEKGSVEK